MSAPSPPADAAAYAALEKQFETLAVDVRLPFLDVKLFKKYFLVEKSQYRFAQLREVVQQLSEHRQKTLRVMKRIADRERILEKIQAKITDHPTSGPNVTSPGASVLRMQTETLQLLFLHQQATYQVVEGIASWRSALTRPYAFHWKGTNYLLKIAADCRMVNSSVLKSILPLRMVEFPLCSNVTSLSLFANAEPTDSEPRTSSPRAPSEQRLRAAELTVLEESKLQMDLVRELLSKCEEGCFLPVLNLPRVIPNCNSGVGLSVASWKDQLRASLKDCEQRAAAGTGAASPQIHSSEHSSDRREGAAVVESGRRSPSPSTSDDSTPSSRSPSA